MTEIERKFLVAAFPDGDMQAVPIRQGYLTLDTDSVELRLRQRGDDYFMTLKSVGGMSRDETEVAIDEAQFSAFWPATTGRRIEKTRHVGKLPGGQVFELDVFAGALAPLMLVEVEFPSEIMARAFTPPPWFGAEVTEDKRYKNKALALAVPSGP